MKIAGTERPVTLPGTSVWCKDEVECGQVEKLLCIHAVFPAVTWLRNISVICPDFPSLLASGHTPPSGAIPGLGFQLLELTPLASRPGYFASSLPTTLLLPGPCPQLC